MKAAAKGARSAKSGQGAAPSRVVWLVAVASALLWCALPVERASAEAARLSRVLTDLNDVRDCLPLPDGRLLSATGGGLAVYGAQGTLERSYTELDGLPGTRTLALWFDASRGAVWIGGELGVARVSVAELAADSQRGARFQSVHRFGAPVRALTEHAGALHAAVWERGIARLEDSGSWRYLHRDPALRPTSLASHAGELYVGSAGAGISRVTAAGLLAGPGSRTELVWSLASFDGALWWGGVNGAFRSDGDLVRGRFEGRDVRALLASSAGLWVAGHGLAPTLLGSSASAPASAPTPAPTLASAPAPAVTALRGVMDRSAGQSRLCVGTTSGLYAMSGGALRPVDERSLGANDVAALAEFAGRTWVGSFDRGLFVIDAGGARPVLAGRVDRRINALLALGDRLWVGTARGLYALDASEQIVRSVDHAAGLESADVLALTALTDGTVAVGTSAGFALVSKDEVSAVGKKRGFDLRSVWAIAPAADARLWLGTTRGLYLAERDGRIVRRYSVGTGHLRDDWVTSVLPRGERLFVGTYSQGVSELASSQGEQLLDAANAVRHFGGGYVNVAGLTLRGERLYAATMAGLLVRDLEPSAAWSTLVNAAPGSDVTALLFPAAGGRVVASRRGLVLTP